MDLDDVPWEHEAWMTAEFLDRCRKVLRKVAFGLDHDRIEYLAVELMDKVRRLSQEEKVRALADHGTLPAIARYLILNWKKKEKHYLQVRLIEDGAHMLDPSQRHPDVLSETVFIEVWTAIDKAVYKRLGRAKTQPGRLYGVEGYREKGSRSAEGHNEWVSKQARVPVDNLDMCRARIREAIEEVRACQFARRVRRYWSWPTPNEGIDLIGEARCDTEFRASILVVGASPYRLLVDAIEGRVNLDRDPWELVSSFDLAFLLGKFMFESGHYDNTELVKGGSAFYYAANLVAVEAITRGGFSPLQARIRKAIIDFLDNTLTINPIPLYLSSLSVLARRIGDTNLLRGLTDLQARHFGDCKIS